MKPAEFFSIGMGLVPRIDYAAGGRRGGRGFFMDMLCTLGDEKLGFSGDLEDFPGSRKNLTGDEKGNELFTDFPEIHVPAHKKVFMATVGIAERIGIVFENENFTGKALFS